MPGYRTDFALASVDAWHLVVPDATYWNTYREDNRAASSRFLLKPGWRTVYARRVESASRVSDEPTWISVGGRPRRSANSGETRGSRRSMPGGR